MVRQLDTRTGIVTDMCRFPADILQPVIYTYANARAKAFGIIESALHASSVPSFQAWKQEILVLFIREVTTFTPNDAQPLRELLDVIPGTNYLDLYAHPVAN